MVSIIEREFVKKALNVGYRVDGRGVDEFRKINFEFGNDRGHAILHLGTTK